MVRKTLALSLSPPPWRAHPVKTFFATRRHERGADDKAAVGVDGKGRRQPRPLQSCARLLELLRPSHRELAQPRMVTSFFLQGILFVAHHVRCGGYFISEHPAPPRTPRGFQHGYRHGLPCCGATRTSVCMWFPDEIWRYSPKADRPVFFSTLPVTMQMQRRGNAQPYTLGATLTALKRAVPKSILSDSTRRICACHYK